MRIIISILLFYNVNFWSDPYMVHILYTLSKKDRLDFAKRHLDKIINENDFSEVTATLPKGPKEPIF